MTAAARNPWLAPGIVAGLAIAGALILLWPRAVEVPKGEVNAAAASKKNDLCLRCERLKCAPVADACFPPETATASLTGAGEESVDRALASACREVLECVRRTRCGRDDPAACYCGEGIDPDDCERGSPAPSGACKDVIEKHAGTHDPATVAKRFSNHEYGTGLAMSLYTFCDRDICKEVCP